MSHYSFEKLEGLLGITHFLKHFLQLGSAAKDITSTLETGLQNVAENLEGAFVTIGETTADRAGWVIIVS